MRALGIDFGVRRIGLAVSDESGTLALPVGTVERRSLEKDLAQIETAARERDVDRVVVGLPIHMNGSSGPEAEAARRFAEHVGKRLGVPIHFVDERWTTALAERSLRETGRRKRSRRSVVDAVAATLLLRTWLESRPRQPEDPVGPDRGSHDATNGAEPSA